MGYYPQGYPYRGMNLTTQELQQRYTDDLRTGKRKLFAKPKAPMGAEKQTKKSKQQATSMNAPQTSGRRQVAGLGSLLDPFGTEQSGEVFKKTLFGQ